MAKKSAFSTSVAPNSSGSSNRRSGRRSHPNKTSSSSARAGPADAPGPTSSGAARVPTSGPLRGSSTPAPAPSFTLPSPSRLLPQHYRRAIDPVLRTVDESSRLAAWKRFLSDYSGDVETLKLPLSCQMASNFLFLVMLNKTESASKGRIRAFNVVALVLGSLTLAIAQSFATHIKRRQGCWTRDDKQFLRRWRNRPTVLSVVLSYPVWLYKLCILAELATVVVVFYDTSSLISAVGLAICPALAGLIGWMGLNWLGDPNSSSSLRHSQTGLPFLEDLE